MIVDVERYTDGAIGEPEAKVRYSNGASAITMIQELRGMRSRI